MTLLLKKRSVDASRRSSSVSTPAMITHRRKISHSAKMQRKKSGFNCFVLKFIKYNLPSTMTDERLDYCMSKYEYELTLLFVHPNIMLDDDAVIDEFGKSNRRLQFC